MIARLSAVLALVVITATLAFAQSFPGRQPRIILTSALSLYVNNALGSDSNNCRASGTGACKTLQVAYDAVASSYDLGGKTVTINVADATYTGCLTVGQPWTGGGAVTITGNASTPANVFFQCSSGSGIRVNAPLPGTLTIQNMKITPATGGNYGITLFAPGVINFSNIVFGSTTNGFHIGAIASGSTVNATGAYSVIGGGTTHVLVQAGLVNIATAGTITLTGTPNFSLGFAYATRLGAVVANALTFSGSATGPKFHGDGNAVVFVNGANVNYLPGTADSCNPASTCLTSGAQYQ